jgi:hypothetical protein
MIPNAVSCTPEVGSIERRDDDLYAVYFKDGGCGFINSKGNLILKTDYLSISPFREGLSVAKKRLKHGYKYGYIDRGGNTVIDFKFDSNRSFHDGLAAFSIRGHDSKVDTGFMNKKGEVVIDTKYDYKNDFSEGFASVMVGGYWFYIDKKGRDVFKTKYSMALPFSEGLAAVRPVGTDSFGFINNKGDMVISPQFGFVHHVPRSNDSLFFRWCAMQLRFSEGVAAVKGKNGNEFFYIDKKGIKTIDINYDFGFDFSGGLAVVGFGAGMIGFGKFGYIDKNGDTVIEPFFYRAKKFSEGLAAVTVSNKKSGVDGDARTGFIDRNGNIVIEPKYYMADSFKNGLARVWPTKGYADDCVYINKKGEIIWNSK